MTSPIHSSERDQAFYHTLHSAWDKISAPPSLGLSFHSSICRLEEGQEEEPPIDKMPPPCMPIRSFFRIALFVVGAIALAMGAVKLIGDKILGQTAGLKARKQFAEALEDQDPNVAVNVMQQLVEERPLLAPQPLVDFLAHENYLPHLKEIMGGANVLIEDTSEELFTTLTQLEGAKRRPSSHPHIKKTSYGVATPLFGELLFWIDPDQQLRLQFEAHPLTSVYHFLSHTADFLRYRLTGAQQGPYGSSFHTDIAPLVIHI